MDTGSTDGTQEIARQCGAEVIDFAWRDSFAAARNVWHKHVKDGWIFWLDCDDEITEVTPQAVYHACSTCASDCLGFLVEYEYPNGYITDHIRLYRADLGITWSGRVHEALEFTGCTGQLERAKFRVYHTGFPERDRAALEAKSKRNMRLLEMELAVRPNDPILHQYVGMEHQAHGRHEEAVKWLQKCLKLAGDKEHFWLPEVFVNLARSYTKLGDNEKAKRLGIEGFKRFGHRFAEYQDRALNIRTTTGETAFELGRGRAERLRALQAKIGAVYAAHAPDVAAQQVPPGPR